MGAHLSFRPGLTLAGRQHVGALNGWRGKPLHPPLTDLPIGAYVIVGGMDVASALTSGHWSRDLFRGATFVLSAGAAASVLTALTGLADWKRSTRPGTQVRREANAHALTMVTVTALVIVNLALRWADYTSALSTPTAVLILSLVGGALVAVGAALGGSLVFDHGFNVEGASDGPEWHPSTTDVPPGATGEATGSWPPVVEDTDG